MSRRTSGRRPRTVMPIITLLPASPAGRSGPALLLGSARETALRTVVANLLGEVAA